jgi:hypothetical protein
MPLARKKPATYLLIPEAGPSGQKFIKLTRKFIGFGRFGGNPPRAPEPKINAHQKYYTVDRASSFEGRSRSGAAAFFENVNANLQPWVSKANIFIFFKTENSP